MLLNCDTPHGEGLDLLDVPEIIEVNPEVAALVEDFQLAQSGEERMEIGRKLSRLLHQDRKKASLLWDLLETGKTLGQLRSVVYNITVKDNSVTQHIAGQQVNVATATDGSTATVDRVSQQLTPGEFSGDALKAEIAELFMLVAERIEALEAKDQPGAMEAITALKQVKFEGVRSEEDARQMLEDLWTDKMESRYSALGKIAEALRGSLGPLVASLLKTGISTLG